MRCRSTSTVTASCSFVRTACRSPNICRRITRGARCTASSRIRRRAKAEPCAIAPTPTLQKRRQVPQSVEAPDRPSHCRPLAALALGLVASPFPRSHTMPAIDARSLKITSEMATRLKSHVDYLASAQLEGRKPGTEGNRQAAEYLVRAFEQLGLEPLASLN